MKVDLSNDELYNLLKNGSTNQKHFVSMIDEYKLDIDNVFDLLEELLFDYLIDEKDCDIRGWINGGALYITDDASGYQLEEFANVELDSDIYLILE